MELEPPICKSPVHPKYKGQVCLCATCGHINFCLETPCAVCNGPVTECDPPPPEEPEEESSEVL